MEFIYHFSCIKSCYVEYVSEEWIFLAFSVDMLGKSPTTIAI